MNDPRFGIRVIWSDEDEEFVATCPDVPGVSALGSSALEAVQELETALALALDVMVQEGRPVPEPRTMSAFSGQFRVRLPTSLHQWLVGEAEREGTSLNTLVVQLLSEGRGARSSAWFSNSVAARPR